MRARLLCLLAIAVALAVSPEPTAAQDAYISLVGEFLSAGDQHDFLFDLERSVGSGETLRFETFANGGGTNAAGDLIQSGGIDSVLELFDGGGMSHGINDDGSPNPGLDSLLSWPGVADSGGSILTDPLPAGSYRLNLSEFGNNAAGVWAVDLVGPADALTFVGDAAIGTSGLYRLTAGNGAQVHFDGSHELDGGQYVFIVDGADMIVNSFLDVGNTSDGHLIVHGSGSTLTTNTESATYLDWGLGGAFAQVEIDLGATATFGAEYINMATDSNINSRAAFAVAAGGNVTLNTMYVGTGVGAAGVTVDGNGSRITQTGSSTLTIGDDDIGISLSSSVRVQNQGTFIAGAGGVMVHRDGAILVDDGTFDTDGNMYVQSVGEGNVAEAGVHLLNQGQINSGNVTVGTIANGGSVLIDGFVPGVGARATWDVTGSMTVGTTGFGTGSTVDVAQGGQLSVSDDVTVGGSMDTTGRLTVQTNGQVTVDDTLFVEQNGTVELLGSEIHTGSFIVDPDGTFTHEDGTLTVDGGQFTMEIGTLTIDGGAGGGLPTLRLENSAQGLVVHDMSGANGEIYVGRDNKGRLEIVDGAHLESGQSNIGQGILTPGSGEGHVLVQGSGSTWEVQTTDLGGGSTLLAYLYVGGNGAGTLEVRDGAQVVVQWGNAEFGSPYFTGGAGLGGPGIGIVDGPNSFLTVGTLGSGRLAIGALDPATSPGGSLTVSNSARVDVAGPLDVVSNGTLHLTSDGHVHAVDFAVDPNGTFIHEDGTLTVDGGSFDPGTAGYLISGAAVGDEPTLELIGGATASFTELVRIGSTGDAAMKVMGSNSQFTSSHPYMDIGWVGSGRLEVLDKGAVDQTGGVVFNLGVAQGASGMVTVDGVDSQIIAGDLIIVGDHGEGHFAVTGGARVTASRLWIAHFSNAQPSDMLVSGDGGAPDAPSLLQISGSAFIGGEEAQGSGVAATMSVTAGAHVGVSNTLKVWPAGTIHLDDGLITAGNVDLVGGRLEGNGNVDVGTGLHNAGSVAPGLSAGVLTIEGADYIQDSAGTLEIEIGGTNLPDFDQLHIEGGAAVLGGTLSVSLIDPVGGGNVFVPTAGNTFEILTAEEGISGFFGPKLLPALTGALTWNVNYDTANSRVLLEVMTPFTADFDLDGDVDGDDLTIWQGAYGSGSNADADSDGDSDGDDFLAWQRQYTGDLSPLASSQTVPEPASGLLGLFLLTVYAVRGCRSS